MSAGLCVRGNDLERPSQDLRSELEHDRDQSICWEEDYGKRKWSSHDTSECWEGSRSPPEWAYLGALCVLRFQRPAIHWFCDGCDSPHRRAVHLLWIAASRGRSVVSTAFKHCRETHFCSLCCLLLITTLSFHQLICQPPLLMQDKFPVSICLKAS